MRVAVVGAGVMGCATAWALTARGADVTLLEQFDDLEHARGSSHGRTRIVRLAYPDAFWVRLAQEAYAGWRELEAESATELLGLVGLVELAPAADLTTRDALDECGVEYRLVREVDGIALPEGWTGLVQPEAGFVRSDLARRAFVDVAVGRGARLETGCRVGSVDELDADAVVVTAGPWVRDLLPDVPVRVTRETVAYFRGERMVPSVVELNAERGHAMFALHDPVHGLKAGAHHAGAEADPDDDGAPDPAVVERIAAWVRDRFTEVDPDPAAADACLYTTTADESFVCERRGRVVVGSACSGHGFKFAPAVARRLAALALAG
ncbi:MAG: FAD-dependent oxidoreductase [Gaiellaceae bacterium]